MKKNQSELKTLQELKYTDGRDVVDCTDLKCVATDWIKVLNDYEPNTNPNLPTSLSDETVAVCNMAIKQWIKHFFNISEEDLDD